MGDVPNSNPLYIYDSTAGEQRSYTSHQQLLADETPVPYLCLYAPCTFVSNPQSEFLSLSLPDTMRLYDSESELEAGYEEQIERPEPEYVDFIDLEVEEDDDQVNFVTNLFERRPRAEGSNNLCLGLSLGLGDIDEDMYDREDANCDVIPELDLELGLGLGSGSGSGDEFGRRTNCLAAGPPNPGEFASVSGQGTSSMDVLRVIDLDSDSESDQNVVYDSRIPSDIVEIDSMERIDCFEQPHFCLGFLGYPQQSNSANGIQFLGYPQQSNGANGIQWQEDELIEGGMYDHDHPNWEFEASSIVIDPLLVEADDILFDWYAGRDHNIPSHISINSDPEYRIFEDPLHGVEGMEFLFQVNNLNREFDEDVVEENVNELSGNPPAAISVVETLPVVNLSVEELTENDTCAICWSEFTTKEPLRKLPCHHYYHGDCIVPWLAIRNTCPVCRYELPTDDLEYEYHRRETEGLDGGGDFIFADEIVDNYENFRVFF